MTRLFVLMFRFDFEFLLAGLADPVVFSFNEGVVVDSLSVVFGAQITFHS